jgi:succinate dehydrogenase/fumarate reductase flavoprotein subunit
VEILCKNITSRVVEIDSFGAIFDRMPDARLAQRDDKNWLTHTIITFKDGKSHITCEPVRITLFNFVTLIMCIFMWSILI